MNKYDDDMNECYNLQNGINIKMCHQVLSIYLSRYAYSFQFL